MQKIYLVSIVNKKKGLGHLMRLNHLVSYFKKNKKIFFLLKNKKFLPKKFLSKPIFEFNRNKFIKKNNSIFILDVDYITKEILTFFNNLNSSNLKIIIYDKKPTNLNYNYLIIPYIYKNLNSSNNLIAGKNSIILNQSLLNNKKLKKKKFIIYINMGASDNNNYTLKILSRLSLFFNNLEYEIKVVIGPFFEKKNVKEIKKLNYTVKNISYIESQYDYFSSMKSASLAIINSGNIKYEISVLGIPFILIANDRKSLPFCEYFKRVVYCKHFNNFKIPQKKKLNNYIKILNKNYYMNLKNFDNQIKISNRDVKKLCQEI